MNGKQLKNSILQWAIQGKLVPQNPKDEPASKLLERIAAARNGDGAAPACHPERNTKACDESCLDQSVILSGAKNLAKKTKKKKPAPASRIYREGSSWFEQVGSAEPKDITEEIPFDIPESWEWCRLKNLAIFLNGDRSKNYPNKSEYVPNGVAWINTGHITPDGYLSTSSMNYISEEKFNSLGNGFIEKGDLVYCLRGATYGKIARIDPFERGAIASSLMIIRPLQFDFREYIYWLLISPYAKQQLNIYANGAAQPNLAAKDIEKYFVPLPPLAEQKRIVKKLEQILPLVDEYDQAQTQLDKLNKELPESLKKSILQQAIQGKLVPQNPKDEPADKLLERITISRHSEHSEESSKKSRKSSSKNPVSRIYRDTDGLWYEQIGTAEPVNITEEIPFEIPETWVWSRFGNFISITTGLAYKKEDLDIKSDESIRVLRGGNIDYGKWCKKDDDVIIASKFVNPELFLKKGMFITPAVTSLEQMGKTALIEENQENIVVGGFVMMLTSSFNDDAFLKYLLNFFQSYYYKKFCQSITNKSGQAFYNLSRQKLLQGLVPIPPLAEQKRIVAKLEQLFKAL